MLFLYTNSIHTTKTITDVHVSNDSSNYTPMGLVLFVCLFGLMLYVHGQQLRSCRDGQLSYPHCSWASLPEAGNQYLAHILSPLTDNCSS